MSRYGGTPRERIVELDIDAVDGAPTRDTAPHLVVSPRTPNGLITGNLALIILPPSFEPAVADTGGFTLTVYRSVPTLGEWGELLARTGINYRDQYVLPDIAGGWGIYFRITNAVESEGDDGSVLMGVAELP